MGLKPAPGVFGNLVHKMEFQLSVWEKKIISKIFLAVWLSIKREFKKLDLSLCLKANVPETKNK